MLKKKIPKNLRPREILPRLQREVDLDEITLLIGSRQSGKTSLMFLLTEFLQKEKKIPPEQIFYFDLENIILLEELNAIKDFEQFVRNLEAEGANLKKRVWVFIDEIQYLDHPSAFLKYLYDHYRGQIKFIVSGSSSLEIKHKFTDRLTGRIHPLIIHPLSFNDYLAFSDEEYLFKQKQRSNLWTAIRTNKLPSFTKATANSLSESFGIFSLFGGYPGVTLKREYSNRIEDLAQIYSLYVRKDIKDIGHIEDIKGFNNLVSLLAHQIGSLVNESELSIGTGLSRLTIRKYLNLLENTFICSFLRPFFTNARSEYSKMPKVYFADPGLRNAVVNNFDSLSKRGDIGHLLENTVFVEITKRLPLLWEIHFWRSERKSEVDFVLKEKEGNVIPIEVKYQTFVKAKIPTGLRSFIKRYQPEKAIVITRDFSGEEKIEKTLIYWLPAWMI